MSLKLALLSDSRCVPWNLKRKIKNRVRYKVQLKHKLNCFHLSLVGEVRRTFLQRLGNQFLYLCQYSRHLRILSDLYLLMLLAIYAIFSYMRTHMMLLAKYFQFAITWLNLETFDVTKVATSKQDADLLTWKTILVPTILFLNQIHLFLADHLYDYHQNKRLLDFSIRSLKLNLSSDMKLSNKGNVKDLSKYFFRFSAGSLFRSINLATLRGSVSWISIFNCHPFGFIENLIKLLSNFFSHIFNMFDRAANTFICFKCIHITILEFISYSCN